MLRHGRGRLLRRADARRVRWCQTARVGTPQRPRILHDRRDAPHARRPQATGRRHAAPAVVGHGRGAQVDRQLGEVRGRGHEASLSALPSCVSGRKSTNCQGCRTHKVHGTSLPRTLVNNQREGRGFSEFPSLSTRDSCSQRCPRVVRCAARCSRSLHPLHAPRAPLGPDLLPDPGFCEAPGRPLLRRRDPP
jgi:hypothetical protein